MVMADPSDLGHGKKLSEEEVDLVRQLDEASAKPASIAEVLNKKRGLGATFDGQFIRNVRSKLAKTKEVKTVKEALIEIEESGGQVRIEKRLEQMTLKC